VVFTTVRIPSEAQVDRFIERSDAFLARGEPYVVVFDNSMGGRATRYMREQAGAWLRTNSPALGRCCAGTALVFASAALRFVMSTVMLFASHPVEHLVCRDLDEALAWGRAQLEASTRASG